MDFAEAHLEKQLPKELVRIIKRFEPDARYFHLKLELDNYTIYVKSVVCRQLKKYKQDLGDVQTVAIVIEKSHSKKWDDIILNNKYSLKNLYCIK